MLVSFSQTGDVVDATSVICGAAVVSGKVLIK